MCITSINRKECFKLVLRSKRNFFAHRLPSARDVFQSLKKDYCKGPIWISDMFPHDFVYKPLIYDLMEIHNDDEYKILKRIKQARYIHNSIWEDNNKTQSLIRNILDGEIMVNNDNIQPAFYQKQLELKKEFHPEYHDPVVYSIKENTLFDVFIGTDLETKYKICEKRFLEFNGNEFEIVSVERIIQSLKSLLIFQTDGKVDESYQIDACSKSVFRVWYDTQNKVQYLKAGSVLDIDDCASDNRCVDWYPYVIFVEE